MGGRRGTLEDRFWPKVRPFSDGCWVWTGTISNIGYPRVTLADGRIGYAHRVMHELVIGPIPDAFEVDHLCGNRWCVNPAHLEAVSLRENRRRRDARRPRRSRRRTASG